MKNILRLILFVSVFFSCRKDKSAEPENTNSVTQPTIQSGSSLPMAVGNYWIYQKSNDDTLRNLNLQNEFDSVYVEKDTLIAGEQYFKFRHTNVNLLNYFSFYQNLYPSYLKDSAGYIVTSNHGILLDKVHILDTIFENVMPPERTCVVPDVFTNKQFLSGTYSGNWQKTIYFRNYNGLIVDTICAAYYSNNVGLVKDAYGYSGCLKYCRYSNNLIRYHLN